MSGTRARSCSPVSAPEDRRPRRSAALLRLRRAGTHVADLLVRSGIGLLRIVDRDFVELSNLHRQALFDESDVTEGLQRRWRPSALRAINTGVRIEPVVAHLDAGNVERYAAGTDLLLDGTRQPRTPGWWSTTTPCALPHAMDLCRMRGRLRPHEHPAGRDALPAPFAALRRPRRDRSRPATRRDPGAGGGDGRRRRGGGGHQDSPGAVAAASREPTAFDLWSNSVQRLRLRRGRRSPPAAPRATAAVRIPRSEARRARHDPVRTERRPGASR